MATPAVSNGEAARLLVEVSSFLRLGLIDKAIEHLAGALARDPSLRELREPLVKLYVARRQYHLAIAELWALLSPCDDPREEIRYLRYILRLGGKDQAALQRLKAVLDKQELRPAQLRDDAAHTRLSLSGAVEELRDYLLRIRPASDLQRTINFNDTETRRLDDLSHSQAATRHNVDEIEAAAEEMALTGGGLTQELQELDAYLDRKQFDEAQAKLEVLSERFPHSKEVRARMRQLFQAQGYRTKEPTLILSPSDRAAVGRHFHSEPTLPPGGLPTVLLSDAVTPVLRDSGRQSTIELDSDDLSEVSATPNANRPPRNPPPPPPGALGPEGEPQSDAESALRTAVKLHSFGHYAEAIAMLDKARDDATWGVPAALLSGLSHRAQGAAQEAIAAFRRGIDRPEASDADLSRLYYELGATFEKLGQAEEALLYYQLSLGATGTFYDAAERIAALQEARTTS